MRNDKVLRRRVVSARVAGQVREMMLGVVRSGTGTAAAIPGVQVAGKTGTAELRPNSTNPKDADAWFVAFAPAAKPKVAVAVMLVGAGFGRHVGGSDRAQGAPGGAGLEGVPRRWAVPAPPFACRSRRDTCRLSHRHRLSVHTRT